MIWAALILERWFKGLRIDLPDGPDENASMREKQGTMKSTSAAFLSKHKWESMWTHLKAFMMQVAKVGNREIV